MKHLKNEIEIELTDENGELKKFNLRYDLNALDQFETLYNKSILQMFKPSIDDEGRMIVNSDGMPVNIDFRVGMIRDLLWVGLQARHPEITREGFGAMLELEEATDLLPQVTEAIGLSNKQRFPPEKLEAEVGGKKRPKK